MPQATLLVRHQVENYAAWRSVYDGLDGLRREYGCTGDEVMVDPADEQNLIIIHRFPTLEHAQSFAGSNELREGMSRAGVKSAPRIEFAVEA